MQFKTTAGSQDFYERHFLNDVDSHNTGSARLDFSTYRKGTKAKGYYWSLSGALEIRDCQTRIDLSFGGNTGKKKDGLDNSRRKLEKLKLIAEKGLAVIDAMEAAHIEKNK